MEFKRDFITGVVLGLSIPVIAVIALYFMEDPTRIQELDKVLLSIVAYFGVFARKLITEKVLEFLGLGEDSKEISKLKNFDNEVAERLEETDFKLKRLEDTQEIARSILDKLELLVDKLEEEEAKRIRCIIDSARKPVKKVEKDEPKEA